MIPRTHQFTFITADDADTDAIAINIAIRLSVSYHDHSVLQLARISDIDVIRDLGAL